MVNIVSKLQNNMIMVLYKSAVRHIGNFNTYVYKTLEKALYSSISRWLRSKNNLNHGFNGLPLTFLELNAFFPMTQFSTSGTLKVNKLTCFSGMGQPVLDQCFLNEKISVNSKFFDSLLKKDLNFMFITSPTLFRVEKYMLLRYFKTIAFLKRGSSTLQSLSRALYRSYLYAPY